jgi:amidase
LTEVFFDYALERAQELDDEFKKNGRLVGPLHGVPMTLKDQFDVAGYDSTLGYVGRAFKQAEHDCILVSILKRMGAVIIAKSNLPQSIMVRQDHAHSEDERLMNGCSGVRQKTRFGV